MDYIPWASASMDHWGNCYSFTPPLSLFLTINRPLGTNASLSPAFCCHKKSKMVAMIFVKKTWSTRWPKLCLCRLAMDWYPIQGESSDTPCCFMLRELGPAPAGWATWLEYTPFFFSFFFFSCCSWTLVICGKWRKNWNKLCPSRGSECDCYTLNIFFPSQLVLS